MTISFHSVKCSITIKTVCSFMILFLQTDPFSSWCRPSYLHRGLLSFAAVCITFNLLNFKKMHHRMTPVLWCCFCLSRGCCAVSHSCACSSSTTASSSFFSCWLWTACSSTFALSRLFSVSTFFSCDSRRRTSSSR